MGPFEDWVASAPPSSLIFGTELMLPLAERVVLWLLTCPEELLVAPDGARFTKVLRFRLSTSVEEK
jgi:hypothetical protein